MNTYLLSDLLTSSLFGAESTSEKPLSIIRQSAQNSAIKKGIPTPSKEDWKYINLYKHIKTPFQLAELPLNNSSHIDSNNSTLVFLDGYYSSELSKNISENVEINLLDDLSIPGNFNTLVNTKDNPFVDINTSLFNHGIHIHCHAGEEISIQILHIIGNSSESQSLLCNPRMFISVQENAKVKLLESYSIYGKHHIINEIIELDVHANSSIDYTVNQTSLDDNYLFYGHYSSIKSKASSTIHIVNAGTSFTRNEIHASLVEQYAEANIYGAILTKKTEFVDNHTVVNHIAPHCESNELFKHILNDESTIVFNGKIFVFKDAQKTNAYQSNKSLLLSDSASLNTKPQLEIFADDVKCSHGATSGALDSDQLFYLISRGIPENTAKSLLMKAFMNEIIDDIPQEDLKESIDDIISEYLTRL